MRDMEHAVLSVLLGLHRPVIVGSPNSVTILYQVLSRPFSFIPSLCIYSYTFSLLLPVYNYLRQAVLPTVPFVGHIHVIMHVKDPQLYVID